MRITRVLSRWFLPLLALLSAVTTLAVAGFNPDYTFVDTVVGGALALVLAGLLFAVSYRYFTTTELPETDARTVALWTAAGTCLYAVVTIWSLALTAVTGGVGPQLSAVTTLTAGTLGGAVFGIVVVRARRHAEQKQVFANYRELFDKADDGIALTDPETGQITEINQRYAELLGYDVTTLRDMRIGDISADDQSFDHATAMTRVQQAVDGEPQQFDWLFERADGSHLWTEVSLKRTTIGGEVRLLAFVRDASERKRRERDLEFFEELVESIGVGVGVYREDGRLEYVNETFAANLGTDRRTLVETPIWELNPAIEQERFDEYWASFDVGETRTTEGVHRYEGREIPVEMVTTCREINGTLYHFGTVQDVTERTEQAARFQAFVEQSNDIITVLDPSGTYEYQSPSAQRILGYASEELIGENAFEHIHPDDRDDVFEQFEVALTDPDAVPVVEYRFRHADGSWRWLESRGFNQLENSAVEEFVINSRDVTDRKEHERQVASLHNATREMVKATDKRAVCDIALETAETDLDHSIAGVWLADADGERLEPAATTDATESLVDELPVYTDGNSLSWRAFDAGETIVTDDLRERSELYNPDTQIRSEIIVPLGEYGVLNIGSTDPNAFTDNDVALAKLLGANTQVALDRGQRERLLERQTDRMEFFNSILRHDVLNAVTVIKSRAEFLQADLEGEQLRDVETILSWSDDVEAIVGRVRTVIETLTGDGNPQLEPVDLVAALGTEVDRVEETYPAVTIETHLIDDGQVLANDLIGDVLGNIVTNAIEHNDVDGLNISITVERSDEELVVHVADNGQGVPDDRKEGIFRRGETGHAKSVGSGFGLFFVDAMMTEYGGDVRVEDNDDGGATFVLSFPAQDSEVAP